MISTFLAISLLALQQGGPDGPPPQDGRPGFQGGPQGPGGPGGPFGPGGAEREILDTYDADDNGRLEGAEIDAAREALKKDPPRQRGGRRGPMGPGRERPAGTPGPKVAPEDAKSYPEAKPFAHDIVRTVFLEFESPTWEEDLELFHNTDVDLPATLRVDGKEVRGVGVHFRGASSYMGVPRGSKRSLNVSVDHTDAAARALGQRTLNLLNCAGDSSMLSAILYSRLAEGRVPAPQACFVQVVVNGESWGPFVCAEQFNRDFAAEHWPQFGGEGARWKVHGSPRGDGGLADRGDELEPYRERYELKTAESEADWDALVNLCQMLSGASPTELEAELPKIFDVDGALWFLALDIATANTDGYWTRASDFSIYRDPEGRFHVFPHDMNEAFMQGHGGPGGPGGRGGFGRGGRSQRGMDGPPGEFGPAPGPQGEGQRPQGPGPQGGGLRPQGPGPQGQQGPQGGPARQGGAELDPLMGMEDEDKPLRSALLAVPAWREKYIDHIRELAQAMRWEELGPFIAEQRELVDDLVAADTRGLFSQEEFERATGDEPSARLHSFLDARSAFLTKWVGTQAEAKPAPAE